MNNEQFRRLLFDNNKPSSASSTTEARKQDGSVPSSLGSRMRSSIPMTPRHVAGSPSVNFARQLREANAPPAKKFKSTAAPKGTKLAAGYVDRARTRDDDEEDDVAKRIKALEEMVKLGQMEQDAFERVRDELIGGDVKNVHLVKGLDRKLLERARRGEDVFAAPAVEEKANRQEEVEDEIDVDRAFEELEATDVVPIVRTKQVDEYSGAPAGKKRTRDDILKDLKEARRKAAEEAAPQQQALGSRFRKVTEKLQPGGSRLEIDEKGREVLIVMDMDGTIKRKIKKAKPTNGTTQTSATETLPAPDKTIKLLGADVVIPERAPVPPEPEEEQDLFADAGTDYDPLAGIDESDSDAAEASDGEIKSKAKPPKDEDSAAPRNYFNEKAKEEPAGITNPIHDAEFLAAIKKAASVADRLHRPDNLEDGLEDDEEKLKKLARRREMLQTHDRDAEDMDLGFGSSRFDDQEDGEDKSYKLSKWRDQGEDDTKGHNGQNKRKRGPKKKKGDKNNANDVLAVLDRRAKS